MMKVLFVCRGNTCRSPMAMALFNRAADKENRNGSGERYYAESAGLSAWPGEPANPDALAVMKEYPGCDLSRHRAKMLDRTALEQSEIILTMECSHKERILSMYPDMHQKVFTFKEYACDVSGDIRDPFGRGLQTYRLCADELAKCVENLLEKLKKN